jgi:uncharacterized protein (TIGR02300 family)
MIMFTNVASKSERGVKRTCQNPECASRFYDLNRDTIVCPICQSSYTVVRQPPPHSSRPTAKPYKKPPPIVREEVKAEEGADTVEIEAGEETADEVADDTLIEEVDDDNVDVTGIVDTPTHGDEKA